MMVDIATHIVVDNNIGNPKTLGDAFTILNKEKYLSEDESKPTEIWLDLEIYCLMNI